MSRAAWLKGRYANVDGIPFKMLVETRSSPALMALFSVNADAAQAMLPGQELQVARVWKRGLLVIAVVNYTDTTIGKYVEFCIGLVCTHGRRRPPRLLPMALPFAYRTGVYIYDLPVSTEISVKGGLGIWGMPKRQGALDFVIGDRAVSSQYDFEGQLVARVDVPRRKASLPFFFRGLGYGAFRGLLIKSRISGNGRAGLKLGGNEGMLLIGDHPRAEILKRIDIDPKPLLTGFVPRFAGVLDDHIETWFLTADQPPPLADDNLRDVVDLGLSQAWLDPPDRRRSEEMLRLYSPDQRVGRAARRPVDPTEMRVVA